MTTARDAHEQRVRAFNRHDAAGVAALYAEDARVTDPRNDETLEGRLAVEHDYAEIFESFPDARVEIVRFVDGGDTIAYDLLLRGTHTAPMDAGDGTLAPTNRRLELPMAVFGRVDRAGTLREVHRYYDVMEFMRQLDIGSPHQGVPATGGADGHRPRT